MYNYIARAEGMCWFVLHVLFAFRCSWSQDPGGRQQLILEVLYARLAQSDRASDFYGGVRSSEGCEFDPRGGLCCVFPFSNLSGYGNPLTAMPIIYQ